MPPITSDDPRDAPHDGGPFGRHAAMWLFHLICICLDGTYICLNYDLSTDQYAESNG